MMVRAASAVVLLLVSSLATARAADWTYEGATGPDYWVASYATCGHSKQSPINIYEGDVKISSMQPFVFTGYDTQDSTTIRNNGHSVAVDLSMVSPKTISGGGLVGQFQAAQFHFHWGADDTVGSEHLISSQAFPMELHIVHYNTKYSSLTDAVSKSDGLAVLGFMFEVGSGGDNTAYNTIINGLGQIGTSGSTADIPGLINLRSLMADTADFYRYSGSLTTPSCDESVTWTVFKSTIKISKAQLAAFRTVLDDKSQPIVNNYRPVQPRNGREVEANFDPHLHWGYINNAANHWQFTYEACGGSQQSPINIDSRGSSFDTSLPEFQYNNYDTTQGIAMELSNNGHTVQVAFTSGSISINGGGLGQTYTAAQFHLHWGSSMMKGSEHTLDGSAYPAELHIVHYKASLGSLGAAAAQRRGLAVLGFFFEVSNADNPALKPLIDALVQVGSPGSRYNMPTVFSLNSILPDSFQNYYRYDGSLTTPGCFESVIWTVFSNTIKISSSQLSALRRLQSSEEENGRKTPLQDNYRPVQPLGTRVVRRNFQISSATWSYEGPTGVQFWSQSYPKCSSAGASAQSPVDLVDTRARYVDIVPITLMSYRNTQDMVWDISNNGHSVTATLKSGDMGISGAGLSDVYKVAQFHFHWGSSSDKGSEHLVNSKAYPMELHIVHFGQSRGSLGNAVNKPNGLAVLGFMFEVASADNPFLTPIVEKLNQIKYKGNETSLASFSLRDIIPTSLTDFYRYSGSLTTPPCYESVTWTVFKSTIQISESQLQQFRAVMSSDKDPVTHAYKPMVNNFRPPQPLNGRVVYANFKLDPDTAIGVKASVTGLLICLLFSSLASLL